MCNIRNKGGFAVLAAMLSLLVITAIGLVLNQTGATSQISKAGHSEDVQAFYVSQAGLEYAAKKAYEGQPTTVNEPGISIGNGSFTVSQAGNILTVQSVVNQAADTHLIDTPTPPAPDPEEEPEAAEANCLEINLNALHLSNNEQGLKQIKFRNTCEDKTITIDKVMFTWTPTDNEEHVMKIKVQSKLWYNGTMGINSGIPIDITNYALSNPAENVMNQTDFCVPVGHKTFTISFLMADGSTASKEFGPIYEEGRN